MKIYWLLAVCILAFVCINAFFGLDLGPAEILARHLDSIAEQTKRRELKTLFKLWGKVKYFHPALAERPEIDWDAALVGAIPRVRTAKTSDEFAAAVQSMLAVLDDPQTMVSRLSSGEESHSSQKIIHLNIV